MITGLSTIIAFLRSGIGRIVAIVAAVAVFFVTFRWHYKSAGRDEERERATKEDQENADRIRRDARNAADRVRDAHPDDFFRD